MRERFRDLLEIDGVRGVLFFTLSGHRVYEEFTLGRNGSGKSIRRSGSSSSAATPTTPSSNNTTGTVSWRH